MPHGNAYDVAGGRGPFVQQRPAAVWGEVTGKWALANQTGWPWALHSAHFPFPSLPPPPAQQGQRSAEDD